MFSLESAKISALWPNDSLTFTFYVIVSNSMPNWATFVKEVFDLMNGLESDKMTALWRNYSLTFTFQIVHQVQQLVKEVFGLNAWFTKWLFCKKMTP